MDGKKEDSLWEYYLTRKVYVVLEGLRKYEGKVESVTYDTGAPVMCLKDKYGKKVCFRVAHILSIQEESV